MASEFGSRTKTHFSSSSSLPHRGSSLQPAFVVSGSVLHSSGSNSTLHEGSPYEVATLVSKTSQSHQSLAPSIADKFSLSADPAQWGSNLSPDNPEPDDYLHNPDPRRDRRSDVAGTLFTIRGFMNLGCLCLLCASLLTLFAGYPIISYVNKKTSRHTSIIFHDNSKLPDIPGKWNLVDDDTPDEVRTRFGYNDDSHEYHVVFSDEFNQGGRTFWPGDDPYWEALDLHYWQTNNIEWYSPEAIATSNGSLEITLSAKPMNGRNYTGGMMSSWNKFCFTGGIIETSVMLPGNNEIIGLWPAIWTMGNLGRAGYGASLDGMWPYTYDACDVGTVANQTKNGEPYAATINGDKSHGDVLSYLPGQRLSRCTCTGDSHPGPVHSDGTYVGRAAPEIDVFEAQISKDVGYVSQSCQWGPFNYEYAWFNTSENLIIPNASISKLNTYTGGIYQQATSVVSKTAQHCYENEGGCFAVYGFEYVPGFDDAYISWINNGALAWTLNVAGMGADDRVEIAARPVPQEPMYIIANLGMSTNFGYVDLDHLTFPTTMRIDYIRVYQRSDRLNIGCDPDDFPTAAYIAKYSEAYSNSNLTTWVGDYGQVNPGNSFLDQC
ncbi:glycoside hydrolase family 16 protein [Fistulina hepatica ATCC 64428]|uniref:Glycoside hydrolase family 16 protein n=1 Tax=Fistulina hepatica ATCC 64428 TaxID=1128425 RepID=A0A0D7A4K9_9AGAR|nr:glycoside hydrolase family 16 protein [Fistulina hepatica ATCC 64428]